MKRNYKAIAALLILTQLCVFSLGNTALAAAGHFAISPSGSTITQGSTVILTIIAVPGSAKTNVVQACIIVDQGKVQLINTDYSANPLKSTTPGAPSSDCAAGEIQLGRYDTTAATGSFTVAKLTFKVLQSSGSAVLSFDDARSTLDSDTIGGSATATIIMAPVPAAPPSPTPGTPPPTTTIPTPPRTTTPTPTRTTTPAPTPAPTNATTTVPSYGGNTNVTVPSITDVGQDKQATSSDVKQTYDPTLSSTSSEKKSSKKSKQLLVIGGFTFLSLLLLFLLWNFVILPIKRRRAEDYQPIAPIVPYDPSYPTQYDVNQLPVTPPEPTYTQAAPTYAPPAPPEPIIPPSAPTPPGQSQTPSSIVTPTNNNQSNGPQ